ncbi:hypothetical protein DRN74_04170 [Candidatus Micrarchaeota archaeon]|nr:MAG: hypothetical protein DRN74_04170 [Candidatus Micrarchaeota archaeon]
MIAILSIKVKYVDAILRQDKRYEFRKAPFKKDVDEVLVYATKPISKIVCKFHVGKIIKDKPEKLWKNYGNLSGLTKKEFFTYFSGMGKGVAIEIIGVKKFSEPIDPKLIYPKFTPPQSWVYLPPVENLLKSHSGGKNDRNK